MDRIFFVVLVVLSILIFLLLPRSTVSCLILFLLFQCALVFGKPLVRELIMYYSHTKWNLLSSLCDSNELETVCSKQTMKTKMFVCYFFMKLTCYEMSRVAYSRSRESGRSFVLPFFSILCVALFHYFKVLEKRIWSWVLQMCTINADAVNSF